MIKFLKVLLFTDLLWCNYHALFQISCAMVLVNQRSSDGKGKQHTEFLFSGQWLDESNKEAPFSSLVSITILTKLSMGLLFAVWLVPSKTTKFNHPRKFVPIR